MDDLYREYVTLHENFDVSRDGVEYDYKEDLERAHDIAERNSNEFPRSVSFFDIFNIIIK